MVDDALHANQTYARDAKVPHQLFWMHLAKIRIFHHFVVLTGVFESQVVFGKLLRLERLLQARLAQRAEGQALLLNLDQAHLAEGMAAVEVSRHTRLPIEVLVARGTVHYVFIW